MDGRLAARVQAPTYAGAAGMSDAQTLMLALLATLVGSSLLVVLFDELREAWRLRDGQ